MNICQNRDIKTSYVKCGIILEARFRFYRLCRQAFSCFTQKDFIHHYDSNVWCSYDYIRASYRYVNKVYICDSFKTKAFLGINSLIKVWNFIVLKILIDMFYSTTITYISHVLLKITWPIFSLIHFPVRLHLLCFSHYHGAQVQKLIIQHSCNLYNEPAMVPIYLTTDISFL